MQCKNDDKAYNFLAICIRIVPDAVQALSCDVPFVPVVNPLEAKNVQYNVRPPKSYSTQRLPIYRINTATHKNCWRPVLAHGLNNSRPTDTPCRTHAYHVATGSHAFTFGQYAGVQVCTPDGVMINATVLIMRLQSDKRLHMR